MNRAALVREYKALFPKLRPVTVRWIHATFAEGPWLGLYCPGVADADVDTRTADTILINTYYADTDALVRGTLIHELMHCEQFALGHVPSHGKYFQERRLELEALTGVSIPKGY